MDLPFKGNNRVTSPYGYRIINGENIFHAGLDIVGDDEPTVRSVCDGTVATSTIITSKTDKTWQWGNYVRVDDAKGNRYFYCHMKSRCAVVGQKVSQGDALGIMGNTGLSYGAHLHLQMRDINGKERCVPNILGIENACGIYLAGVSDKAQGTNALWLATIGPVSKGDLAKVESIAKEIGVKCVIKNA